MGAGDSTAGDPVAAFINEYQDAHTDRCIKLLEHVDRYNADDSITDADAVTQYIMDELGVDTPDAIPAYVFDDAADGVWRYVDPATERSITYRPGDDVWGGYWSVTEGGSRMQRIRSALQSLYDRITAGEDDTAVDIREEYVFRGDTETVQALEDVFREQGHQSFYHRYWLEGGKVDFAGETVTVTVRDESIDLPDTALFDQLTCVKRQIGRPGTDTVLTYDGTVPAGIEQEHTRSD